MSHIYATTLASGINVVKHAAIFTPEDKVKRCITKSEIELRKLKSEDAR